MRRFLLWLLWASALALLVAAIFLPNTGLAQLRSDFRWLSRIISWTEKQWPALDMIHIVMFFTLTLLTRLTWPRWLVWQWLMVMVAVAAVTELVQLSVPGRRASWSDFQQDLIGVATAYLAWLVAGSLIGLGHAYLQRREASSTSPRSGKAAPL